MEPVDLTCGVTFNLPNGFPTTAVSDVCDPGPVVTSSLPVPGGAPGPVTFNKIGDHTIAFTATDQSGNQTSCNWKVTVLPTSFCQKQESVVTLESLLAQDTGDPDLIKAIDHIYVSLGKPAKYGTSVSSNPSIWGDPTHVDTCNQGWNGPDVFLHERVACTKLDDYVKNFRQRLVPLRRHARRGPQVARRGRSQARADGVRRRHRAQREGLAALAGDDLEGQGRRRDRQGRDRDLHHRDRLLLGRLGQGTQGLVPAAVIG